MRGRVVRGHTEHDDPGPSQVRPEIAEAAGLLRAPGRVVLRVEVDDHVLAFEVRQRHALAGGVLEREVGSLAAFGDHRHARVSRTLRSLVSESLTSSLLSPRPRGAARINS